MSTERKYGIDQYNPRMIMSQVDNGIWTDWEYLGTPAEALERLAELQGEATQPPMGLYNKYNVTKADGSLIDPEAQYFVLRLDTDEAARAAAKYYAGEIMGENEQLAVEIYEWAEELERGETSTPLRMPPAPAKAGAIKLGDAVYFGEDGSLQKWPPVSEPPKPTMADAIRARVAEMDHELARRQAAQEERKARHAKEWEEFSFVLGERFVGEFDIHFSELERQEWRFSRCENGANPPYFTVVFDVPRLANDGHPAPGAVVVEQLTLGDLFPMEDPIQFKSMFSTPDRVETYKTPDLIAALVFAATGRKPGE